MKNNYIEIIKQKSYQVSSENKQEFIERIIHDNKLVTFLNPYSYLIFRKKKTIFNKFDHILSDGILLTKLLNFSKIVFTERLSFDMTSIAEIVFSLSEKESISLYLIGAKKGEIDSAQKIILKHYPNLNIIGFRHGYFNNKIEEEKIIVEIRKLNPKIIIVGMGSGLQEEFLVSLRKNGWEGTGFSCGGFFHQISKKINYYPELMNKLNLRAIYRIKKEPKLVLRYFFIYPFSVFLFIYDAIHYLLFKNIKR